MAPATLVYYNQPCPALTRAFNSGQPAWPHQQPYAYSLRHVVSGAQAKCPILSLFRGIGLRQVCLPPGSSQPAALSIAGCAQAGALTNNLVPEPEGAPEPSDEGDDGLAELLPAPTRSSACLGLPAKALLRPKLPDVLLAAPPPGAASAAAAALGWPPPPGLPAGHAADAAVSMDMDGSEGVAGEEPATGGGEGVARPTALADLRAQAALRPGKGQGPQGDVAGPGLSLSPPRTPSPAVPAFLTADAYAAPAAPAFPPSANQPGASPRCSPATDPDSDWRFEGLPAACYGVPPAPPFACEDSPGVAAGGDAAAELHLYAVELVVVQAAPPPPPEPEAGAAAEEGEALSAAPDLADPTPSTKANVGEPGPGASFAPAVPRAPAGAPAAELKQPLGLLLPRPLPPLPVFHLELSTGAVAAASLVHRGMVRATQRELNAVIAFHKVLTDPWAIRNLLDTPAAALGAAGAAALEALQGARAGAGEGAAEGLGSRAAAPAVSVTGLTVGALLGTPARAAAGRKRKAAPEADMGQTHAATGQSQGGSDADSKEPFAAEAQPAEGGMQPEGRACGGAPMPHARLCNLDRLEEPSDGRYLLAPLNPKPGGIDWGLAEIASHGFQQVHQALRARSVTSALLVSLGHGLMPAS